MRITNIIGKTKTTSRKVVAQAITKQEREDQLTKEEIQDAIRLKAYELYLQRGAQQGNDFEDWLTAEQIILQSSRS